MTNTPNKHYSAHKGIVFIQDIFAVTDGERTEFFGRFGEVTDISNGAEARDAKITRIPQGDPKAAFLATHNMMNEDRKLGKCLLGYNPFNGKKK